MWVLKPSRSTNYHLIVTNDAIHVSSLASDRKPQTNFQQLYQIYEGSMVKWLHA